MTLSFWILAIYMLALCALAGAALGELINRAIRPFVRWERDSHCPCELCDPPPQKFTTTELLLFVAFALSTAAVVYIYALAPVTL